MLTNRSNSKSRRVFDARLKLQVVQMIKVQGLSIGKICKDMNLGEAAVRRWLMQLEAEQLGQSGIGDPFTEEHQCICELESDNRQLRCYVDILKKPRSSLPVNQLCSNLGLSRPCYYSAVKNRQAAPRFAPHARPQNYLCSQWMHLWQPQALQALPAQRITACSYRMRSLIGANQLSSVWR